MTWQKEEILALLARVMDPEIPVLSLLDLGVIRDVRISDLNEVTVIMTPTFSGCPAMDYMRREVEETLRAAGVEKAKAEMSFSDPWDSNKITEKGRVALKNFGLAPPPVYQLVPDLEILDQVACPHCGSDHTELRSPFGPTLCRSVHFCQNCRQLFQQFKPL